LQPVSLHCDQRTNPIGIDDPAPDLSWQLQCAENGAANRGQVQSAWQIWVGSQPGLSDLWDSGQVSGSETVNNHYAGKPLAEGEQLYWQVRVMDGNGLASAWSAPAQFSMGLMSQTNWSAQWIGWDAAYSLTAAQQTARSLFNTSNLNWISLPSGAGQAGVNQASFRQQVVLPAGQTITNAMLSLYADNYCVAYVNGQQAAGFAARWEPTAQLNVTSLLHSGANIIGLSATNTDQAPAAVIGRLVVRFSSGSISNIPVDNTWKAAQLPPAAWTSNTFNASSWPAAGASSSTPWGTPAVNDLPRVPPPFLRKSFSIARSVARAAVYVTSLGAYELHLNGQKVGRDTLTPGWTQFNKRVYYQTYDVTSMLQSGSNTIGAILGDGWFASDLAFKGSRLNYGGTPRFLAQLIVQLADGSTQTIATDASWKAAYGPILFGDLLMGSEYDARLEMPGWDSTNFNDSAWQPVATGLSAGTGGVANVTSIVAGFVTNNVLDFVAANTNLGGDPDYGVVKALKLTYSLGGVTQTATYSENSAVDIGGSGRSLVIIQALFGNPTTLADANGIQIQAAVTEPSRCFENLPATSMTEPAPGCYTFDIGQNIAGWARIQVTGHAGDVITVRHGEMLNPGGVIYTANLRGAGATDTCILSSNGASIFEPRFTFHGFRYVELRGLSVPPTLASVTGIAVHSDIPATGSFACSSPLVNRLFSNIIWSQKGNYLEVPTDCPQRDERMGWTGDMEFFIPTAAYNFDIQSFFHRHLVTLDEDSQYANGSFAYVSPDMNVGVAGIAWGDAGWVCPDEIYRAYDDTNVIGDHYAALQNYGAYLASCSSNYTLPTLPGDLGDWLNLGGGASELVIDTAFYAGYAQAMSEMAQAIGRASDAAAYGALHSNIAIAFGQFFGSNGAFTDGSSQCGYALAFSLNLVPPALQSRVSQQFANSIAQFDYHLATGFIGTPRLLPALHLAGLDNLAYTLLLQQTYPSWLYQVDLGATTMWERWDGWTPSAGFESETMNSFNHYAFGSVGQYMYGGIGGITPASPGYKTILIAPSPQAGLTWASTSYNSTRGLISTAWTNVGAMLNLAVAIPPNTTAEVRVPSANPAAVMESGVPAASSPGVAYLGYSNGAAIYAVGSGDYLWSSPIQPQVTAAQNGAVFAGGSFPVLPPGNLLANLSLSITSNTLTFGPENTLPANALRDGKIGAPGTTNNSVEISGGAITFYLGPGPGGAGYTVTNLGACTAWRDNGRENANYGVTWSADGVNYFPVANVAYDPSPYPAKDGTGGTLSSVNIANLTGVHFLRWDFTAAQQNGGVGYSELFAFGVPSVPPQAAGLGVVQEEQSGALVMNLSGLSPGQSYLLQSTTNLSSPFWIAETNFVASQASLALTNATGADPAKFYRVVGY
jgi:alpha-L-rhamnosidase